MKSHQGQPPGCPFFFAALGAARLFTRTCFAPQAFCGKRLHQADMSLQRVAPVPLSATSPFGPGCSDECAQDGIRCLLLEAGNLGGKQMHEAWKIAGPFIGLFSIFELGGG